MLLVLATVHLRPLPAAAEQLQYEGSDPGAVVLQVVRGPPGGKDTTLELGSNSSFSCNFCLELDLIFFWGGDFMNF